MWIPLCCFILPMYSPLLIVCTTYSCLHGDLEVDSMYSALWTRFSHEWVEHLDSLHSFLSTFTILLAMTSVLCFDILTSSTDIVKWTIYCMFSIPYWQLVYIVHNLEVVFVVSRVYTCSIFAFWFCRFTFPSFILAVMIFDGLAIGKNPTYTSSFSCIFICCVSSMCSLLYDASVQWNVVLQFCGFNRQSNQCISLLHPLRYLAT